MTLSHSVFYSKKKIIIFCAVALLLLIPGYLLIAHKYILILGGGRSGTELDYKVSFWAGWILAVFAVLAPLVLMTRLLKNKALLVITENGITINDYQNFHSVTWEQVSDMMMRKDFIFTNVLIKLHDPEAYIEQAKKKVVRFTMKSNLKRTGSPLLLNMMILDTNAEDFIIKCRPYLK